MWQKDGQGNWFMAGQEAIDCGGTCEGSWYKADSGDWFLDFPASQAGVLPFPAVGGLSVAL